MPRSRARTRRIAVGLLIAAGVVFALCFGSAWFQAGIATRRHALFISEGQIACAHSNTADFTAESVSNVHSAGPFYWNTQDGSIEWWFIGDLYSGILLAVPLWIPGLLLLIPGVILLVRSRRPRSGLCPNCGYNLAGLAPGSPCPECGPSSVPDRKDH